MTSAVSASLSLPSLVCAPTRITLALATLMAGLPAVAQQQPVQAGAALPPVTVTATRFDEDAQRLPQGVTVLTARDIANSGAGTVNEAIMKLAGVVGRQDFYGAGNYTLDLRGFGQTALSNQVIVVDGVRINEADLGSPSLASLPIDEVERIEVLRGSSAVLYGDGATGGVISITTKAGSGQARASSGQLYAGVGTDRLRDLRASTALSAGGWSLNAAASRRATDNHRPNFASAAEAQSFGAQWAGEGVRAGVSLAHDDLDAGLPGSLSAAQYAVNPRQASTPTNHADIRNERFNAFTRLSLGDWELAFDGGRRHKELRGLSYAYDVDAETYGARARHAGRLAGMENNLVFGLDVNNWYREVLGAFGSKARQHATAVYAKDELTLPTATRVSAGVRTERIDKSDTFTPYLEARMRAWELGAVQPLSPQWSVYGRVARSFRLPNVDEIGFTLPNVLLAPQTSRDTELGARWHAGSTRAELRLYRNALTNEIGYDGTVANPNSFSGFGANVNFDPTLRQGAELEVTHDWTPKLQTRAIAALRRATFRAGPHDGKDVPLTPRQTLSLRADWTFLPQQQLGAVLNLVSSQHPDYDNACRMPGHATADVRYAYTTGPAQWALGVSNLADLKYYTQAYGCTAGTTTAIYPEAGRQFTASMRWSF